MAITQIDGSRQIQELTIGNTQIATDAAIALSKLAEAVIQADGGQAFTGDQSMGGKKLTSVGAPAAGTDAVNKEYVDSMVTAGISWKSPVKLATTAALPTYVYKTVLTVDMVGADGGTGYAVNDILTLIGPTGSAGATVTVTGETGGIIDTVSLTTGGYGYATGVVTTTGGGNGDATIHIATVSGNYLEATAVGILTVDGIATVLGDRILVKNEVVGARNGIYTVTTEGTGGVKFILTRATDADVSSEVDSGIAMLIQSGTVNADMGYIQTTDSPTIEVTALVFVQFTGLGQIVAGAGLFKSAPNTLDVGAGDGIQVDADSVTIKLDGVSLVKSGSGLKIDYSRWITRETPAGAKPGKVFTTTVAVLTDTEQVFLNGILQEASGEDYTFSAGNTITFVDTVKTNDRIKVNYIKA